MNSPGGLGTRKAVAVAKRERTAAHTETAKHENTKIEYRRRHTRQSIHWSGGAQKNKPSKHDENTCVAIRSRSNV